LTKLSGNNAGFYLKLGLIGLIPDDYFYLNVEGTEIFLMQKVLAMSMAYHSIDNGGEV